MTKYCFILPVHNESVALSQSVKLLTEFLEERWGSAGDWTIVLADNGSTDNTKERCAECVAQNPQRIKYLFTEAKGRGQALRAAVSLSNAEIFCYLDIDLPIVLDDLPAMLTPIEQGTADVAVAKRAGPRPALRNFLTLALGRLNHLMLGFNFQDVQSGVKVWNRKGAELLQQCKETGFFLDMELVALATRKGLRVAEVPVRWIERRYPNRVSSVRPARESVKATMALCRIAFKTYFVK